MLLPVLHLLISRFIEPLDAAIGSSYIAFVFCRTGGSVYRFCIHCILVLSNRWMSLAVLHTFHSRFVEPMEVARSSSYIAFAIYRTGGSVYRFFILFILFL